MPQNLTDTSTFTSPIVIPADTDAADLVYVESFAQGLANRTRYLANLVGGAAGTGEWVYADGSRQKKFLIPLSSANPMSSGGVRDWEQEASNSWSSRRNVGTLIFPLNAFLLNGDTIVDVELWYGPGGARSAGNGMKLGLYRGQPDQMTPASNPVSPTLLLSALYGDDSATKHHASLASTFVGATSGFPVVVTSAYDYMVIVSSGTDGSTVIDHVYMVQLTVNRPGPG